MQTRTSGPLRRTDRFARMAFNPKNIATNIANTNTTPSAASAAPLPVVAPSGRPSRSNAAWTADEDEDEEVEHACAHSRLLLMTEPSRR